MTSTTDVRRRDREAALTRVLEERRDEIAGRLHRCSDFAPTAAAKDVDDHAVEELSRDMEFALAQMRSTTLQRIDEAIRRLRDGTYGLCSDCGVDIPEARLRALPFASLCRYCQGERERVEHPPSPLESLPGSRPHAI
jgi:RNA polymerase-binding transcription factor